MFWARKSKFEYSRLIIRAHKIESESSSSKFNFNINIMHGVTWTMENLSMQGTTKAINKPILFIALFFCWLKYIATSPPKQKPQWQKETTQKRIQLTFFSALTLFLYRSTTKWILLVIHTHTHDDNKFYLKEMSLGRQKFSFIFIL